MITVTFLQAWHSLFKILSLQEKWKAQNCFTLFKTTFRSEIAQNCDLSHPPSQDRQDFHTDAAKQHSSITILCISQLVLVISPSGHFCSQVFSHSLFIFKVSATNKKPENLSAIPSFPCITIFSRELINSQSDLTLSSHWASTDAKGFFQIFLHFIFVPTEYKYRTQFCNSGLKMQIYLYF